MAVAARSRRAGNKNGELLLTVPARYGKAPHTSRQACLSAHLAITLWKDEAAHGEA
ncbi:hypothetical protein M2337_001622 [Sphingobium sp. B2D3A]|nr:hypothetical protein [Sphingobium sp. B2D3A]MCW2350956.1 hypothetical protein [Sphingobium sp. B12D2B]MCW2362373.1 hypothetical protein [Sphingobium sp. B10D3B]MCW2365783.1 hypothetical protein [Sphingobium sp. B7D2B]MCW2370119.1 hypothetical protein [Sphingobium sp. B11D3D]MCW2381237.1 hypothetical protein [Sphingobium sp. B2D3B]MCW2383847.1 hypothetical protein [Sphingobium sp. B2D3D]MCW2388617.1 hypothetical protein [Sphingobium sp. B11D3B]MCW2393406.1 hypothetical protein [Sphingobiu